MKAKIIEVNASRNFYDCGHDGRYTVVYDDEAKANPYRIYQHWNTLEDYGISKHKKLIVKYGDYASVMWALYMLTTNQRSVSDFK